MQRGKGRRMEGKRMLTADTERPAGSLRPHSSLYDTDSSTATPIHPSSTQKHNAAEGGSLVTALMSQPADRTDALAHGEALHNYEH